MADKVLIDRDELTELVDAYEAAIDGPFQEGYGLVSSERGNAAEAADRAFVAKLRAALGRDREELIENVAEALDPAAFSRNDVYDPRYRYEGPYSEMPQRRENARRRAGDALAAIERADQEEGDRG